MSQHRGSDLRLDDPRNQANGTNTSPQTTPPTDIEKILEELTFEVIKWNYGASSAECAGERAKAKAEILKHYIPKHKVIEARIEELESLFGEPSISDDYFTVSAQWVENRLAQLRKDLNLEEQP